MRNTSLSTVKSIINKRILNSISSNCFLLISTEIIIYRIRNYAIYAGTPNIVCLALAYFLLVNWITLTSKNSLFIFTLQRFHCPCHIEQVNWQLFHYFLLLLYFHCKHLSCLNIILDINIPKLTIVITKFIFLTK